MSYDLSLYPKQFDAPAIRAWFEGRPHYHVSRSQVWHASEDTGVEFAFEIADERGHGRIDFNLNYARPRFFGLEAALELDALVARFDCRIDDLQAEGVEQGVFSRDGFLSGWGNGNRAAFMIMAQTASAPPPWPAEADLLADIWEWNLFRGRLQGQVGDRLFIPKLRWAVVDGAAPVSCATWTEGVPTLIPEWLITHVLMVRQPRPSLKNLFGAIGGKKKDYELRLAPLSDVRADPDVNRDRNDAGYPTLIAPQSAAVISAGAWAAAEIRILPLQEVCDTDLVTPMAAQ